MTMMERIEELFEELMHASGYTEWWQSEDEWEDWEAIMLERGLDTEMVAQFFKEMGEDM